MNDAGLWFLLLAATRAFTLTRTRQATWETSSDRRSPSDSEQPRKSGVGAQGEQE
jgi:hypothetical protein